MFFDASASNYDELLRLSWFLGSEAQRLDATQWRQLGARFTSHPNACDQDVDHMFGGPLTIGSQAYVRNPGKRAQQVEWGKVQTNVAARDRAIDKLRHCLFHLWCVPKT
jgi:hypothetical protein